MSRWEHDYRITPEEKLKFISVRNFLFTINTKQEIKILYNFVVQETQGNEAWLVCINIRVELVLKQHTD